MLPALLSEAINAEGGRWTFVVPRDHPLFEGHFPGHPILPGVVVLGWTLAAAERFIGCSLEGIELLNVKFQVVVLPGAELELTVVPKTSGRLQAVVRSTAGVHASALIPIPEGSIRPAG